MKFGRIAKVYARRNMWNMEPCDSTCLISIWSMSLLATERYPDYPVPMEGWKGALKLEFDDVIQDRGMGHVLFDEAMAKKTMDFIEKHKGRPFVIHCDAGVSRSVAVGCFLRDAYEYDLELNAIGTDEFRNIHVLNLLRREYYKRQEDNNSS